MQKKHQQVQQLVTQINQFEQTKQTNKKKPTETDKTVENWKLIQKA